MTRNTILLAAVAVTTAATPAARADQVGPTSTQDQANRLSIFHDYGLDVVGNSTGDGGGVTTHGGGYQGIVPVPGDPGQGAAAGIIDKLSDRFTFLRGIQSTDATGTGRSFDVSLGYTSGYDSNPEARRISPGSLTQYVSGDLSATYRLTAGTMDPVVGTPFEADFSYTATGVWYEGQSADADAIQQGLIGSLRRSYADNAFVATATINDQFTLEHGAAFLNSTDATAAGEVFLLSQLSVEGAYDYSHLQYFFKPVNDAQRPTAERHTLDARLHVYTVDQRRGAEHPGATGLTLFAQSALRRATVGYAHVFNYPDQQTGTDYRYGSDRVYIGLDGLTLPPSVKLFGQPIGQGTAASILYAHEFQNFDFDNTASPALAAALGPGHPRKDGLDILTLRSNTRLLDLSGNRGSLTSFLQFDMVHDGSNVLPRHFNEWVFSSGLTYQY